jgi:hypothetical protein
MSDDKKVPSVSFLPERFIRRDTEALAHVVESGENAGKWEVVDDRGRKSYLTDEDFKYEYVENEAHGGPGKINILLPGINALGCRAVLMGADGKTSLDAELNEWFERPEHFGLAVADIRLLDDNRALVFVTRPLTEREIAERAEVAEETRALINKRHETALAQQAEALVASTKADTEKAEKDSADLEELKRLAPIAKRHIENCKGGK